MANSRHYKWQAQWTVADGVATHTSGVIVTARGCTVPAAVNSALASKHGPHNTPQVLDRLAREGVASLAAARDGIPQRHAKIPASSKS